MQLAADGPAVKTYRAPCDLPLPPSLEQTFGGPDGRNIQAYSHMAGDAEASRVEASLAVYQVNRAFIIVD